MSKLTVTERNKEIDEIWKEYEEIANRCDAVKDKAYRVYWQKLQKIEERFEAE